MTRHSFIQRAMNTPVINITTTRQVDITVDEPSPDSAYPLRAMKGRISNQTVFFADGKTPRRNSSSDPVKIAFSGDIYPNADLEGDITPSTEKQSLEEYDASDIRHPTINDISTNHSPNGRFDYFSYQYREPKSPEPTFSPTVNVAPR